MAMNNEQQQNITKANQLACALADGLWELTAEWGEYAKSSVGLPLIHAVDTIGLQLIMSLGRKSINEHIQHISQARKSLTPASYWLQRAAKRGLVDPEEAQKMNAQMAELARRLDQHAHVVLQAGNEKSTVQKNKETVQTEASKGAEEITGESAPEPAIAH